MVAPGATVCVVVSQTTKPERVFKTAWFVKAARKAHIRDEELCSAVKQVKKRLRKNRYRSIILARAGHYWVYEYLFAKQERANIEDHELTDFRKLVKAYAGLTTQQINQLIREGDWKEICEGNQT